MALLAFMLMLCVPRRSVRHAGFSQARWLMVMGTGLIAIQFLIQHIGGFRQMGVTQAVLWNLLMFLPATVLINLALIYVQTQGRILPMDWIVGVVICGLSTVILVGTVLIDGVPMKEHSQMLLYSEYISAILYMAMQGHYFHTHFVEYKRMKPLRIALTKGRLEKDTVKLLEAAGFDCTAVREKGRRLILPIGNGEIEVVLAKAADVITYVENGVCDLGVVGKDTIMENGRSFYEILDLGFGKCRFALAGKKGFDFFSGYDARTIATKYPNVTRNFFENKGMDIRIIKIEGSVELAPLLGLSDAIVDIVETGSTLKENGLVIIEDNVAPISARLIANSASLKLRKAEIEDLADKMETERKKMN